MTVLEAAGGGRERSRTPCQANFLILSPRSTPRWSEPVFLSYCPSAKPPRSPARAQACSPGLPELVSYERGEPRAYAGRGTIESLVAT